MGGVLYGLAVRGGGRSRSLLRFYDSSKAKDVIGRVIRGRIILSHVRHATTGGRRYEDTRPRVYRGQVFARNGVVSREGALRPLRGEHKCSLRSGADSEVFFHLVVQEANDNVEGVRRAIERILREGIRSRRST